MNKKKKKEDLLYNIVQIIIFFIFFLFTMFITFIRNVHSKDKINLEILKMTFLHLIMNYFCEKKLNNLAYRFFLFINVIMYKNKLIIALVKYKKN